MLDAMMVFGLALLLIGTALGTFALADKYNVSLGWILALWLGIGLAVVVARPIRSMFGNRLFLPYFALWILLEAGGTVLAAKAFGTILAIMLMVLGIFVGYAVAFWLFGVPPERRR